MKAFLVGLVLGACLSCVEPPEGLAPPLDRLDYPIATVMHPDGRYLYIANASFERKYRSGTVRVYDVLEEQLLEEAILEIDLFGGELELVVRDERLLGVIASRDTHTLAQFEINADAGDTQGHFQNLTRYSDFGVSPFARDPYSIAVDGDTVMMSHISNGVVSRWSYRSAEGDELSYECSVVLGGTTSQIAKHPVADLWYVTDQTFGSITVLAPMALDSNLGNLTYGTCRLDVVDRIRVSSITTRGLAFSHDGAKLYVVSQTDDSLRVYDTTIGYGGRPRNALIKAVPMGDNPSTVAVEPCSKESCAQSDDSLVYVTVFGDKKLVVFDPLGLHVISRLDVGRAPHDISFGQDGSETAVAFVTNFDEGTISIVDIDADSASRFQIKGQVQ